MTSTVISDAEEVMWAYHGPDLLHLYKCKDFFLARLKLRYRRAGLSADANYMEYCSPLVPSQTLSPIG